MKSARELLDEIVELAAEVKDLVGNGDEEEDEDE